MISKLSGAKLAFQVARAKVPLPAVQARFAGRDARPLAAPRVAVPDIGGALELAPIRQLALEELVSHARTGRATLHLPLPALERSLGPARISIRPGHRAVIDLAVEDGRILRRDVRGPIEPPLPLPLGLTALGVYLGDDGSIFVDIPNFPDINLSRIALGWRVPGTVEEATELFFSDDEEAAGGDRDLALDMAELAVEARNVIPKKEPFHLGKAGTLSLGDETRLDVDFAQDRLAVRGRLEMTAGELNGPSFALLGLSGRGTLTSSLDGLEQLRGLAVDLQIHEGEMKRLWFALPDGTRVELEDVSLEGAEIAYSRRQGKDRFRLSARRVAGRLVGGRVVLRIGEEEHPLDLGSMTFDGSLTVSDRYFDLDVEVFGARIDTEGLDLELGLARLQLGRLKASATGRVKVSTDYGYSFTGALRVEGDVDEGAVALGPLGATIAGGTRAELDIQDLHGGPEGPDALVATGRLDLALASGSLPLGRNAQLSFSRGGEGTVVLEKIELQPGAAYPRVEASGHIVAQADPAVVEEIFEIPAGKAHVEAGRASVSEAGELVVEELRCWLASDE